MTYHWKFADYRRKRKVTIEERKKRRSKEIYICQFDDVETFDDVNSLYLETK